MSNKIELKEINNNSGATDKFVNITRYIRDYKMHPSSRNLTYQKVKLITCIDRNLTYMYTDNEGNQVQKTKYISLTETECFLLSEILNGSLLWTFDIFNVINSSSLSEDIIFQYYICPEYLAKSSQSFTFPSFINSCIQSSPQFCFLKLPSHISTCAKIEQPDYFLIDLYDFQKRNVNKMITIEQNSNKFFPVDLRYKLYLGNKTIFIDAYTKKQTESSPYEMKVKGGILSDHMGLGKTLTCLSLISLHRPTLPTERKLPHHIYSSATLIICPSHLCNQWKDDIFKVFPNATILYIVTKTHLQKLSYENIQKADIIIVSLEFLMNFKYYAKLRTGGTASCSCTKVGFEYKLYKINQHFQTLDLSKLNTILEPNLENFHFHRVIVDETHEIFNIPTRLYTRQIQGHSLLSYFQLWLLHLQSDYRWYVSGTPFTNSSGVQACLQYLGFELKDLHQGEIQLSSLPFCKFSKYQYNVEQLLRPILIYHQKKDVEKEIIIPKHKETCIWVKLTDLEDHIYRHAVQKRRHIEYLQRLCCHIMLTHKNDHENINYINNLEAVKNELIKHNTNVISEYTEKLESISNCENNQGTITRYKNYISESRYLLQTIEKVGNLDNITSSSSEICSICLENFDTPVMTHCGHLFCKSCISRSLTVKNKCPMCKTPLKINEIYSLSPSSSSSQENKIIDSFMQKYGSKLGKIITVVQNIISSEENRVIIFSQWESLLSMISGALKENNISNIFVRGNVWCKNLSINNFKKGNTKVIMLSLENAASGTNLQEATHIVFMEPIYQTFEKMKAIESQAIGRACRLGQKRQVEVIRILTKNTIEEDIYNKIYSQIKN